MRSRRRTFLKLLGASAALPVIIRVRADAGLIEKTGFNMEIKKVGSQASSKGPAEWFTGTVRLDPLFQAHPPARAAGASVTFEPGARTAWHTHPLGQTLIVISGTGWAQREGGSGMRLGIVAMGAALLLATAGTGFSTVNCKQVRKYLDTGRSVKDVAETMVISEDDVKKCTEDTGGDAAKGAEKPADKGAPAGDQK